MKNNNRLLLSLGLIILLGTAFYGFEQYSVTHEVVPVEYERREAAKEFSLPVIGKSRYYPIEDTLNLTAARKKPVLLHFWASWCTVCREEKPGLDEFWAKHQDQDILVLGVASFDTKKAMDDSKLIHDPTFTVVLDEEGAVATVYKVPALPVSILVGTDGYIVKKFKGALQPFDFTTIENYLESLKKAH